MEMTNVEISVPKEMKAFLLNENASDELKRNALILYPYIKDLTISHGRAAEIKRIKSVPIAGYDVEKKLV